MDRDDLTDAQWEKIQPSFPDRYHHGQAGRPRKGHRPLVNGILRHLHTGAPWPDTPERYGPWQTVYDRFNRWRKDGTWAKILDALLLRLDRRGLIDRDPWCVDATARRRHIVGRAIGWLKWCRALATRFDKLAVNYVALWIVANIQYLLREYPEALGIRLSETT